MQAGVAAALICDPRRPRLRRHQRRQQLPWLWRCAGLGVEDREPLRRARNVSAFERRDHVVGVEHANLVAGKQADPNVALPIAQADKAQTGDLLVHHRSYDFTRGGGPQAGAHPHPEHLRPAMISASAGRAVQHSPCHPGDRLHRARASRRCARGGARSTPRSLPARC